MNKTQTVASTVEFIAYYAIQHPNKPAIIENGTEISYGNFYKNICQMKLALDKLGLKRGELACIEATYFYQQWVIMLAFELLGVQTLSYSPDEMAELSDILKKADLIICTVDNEPDSAKLIHIMDNDWFKSVSKETPDLSRRIERHDADLALRLVHGSGTTNTIKTMPHTALGHDFRIKQNQLLLGFNNRSRYFISMSFCLQSFQTHATACLRMGGTCVFDKTISIAEGLRKYQATHVTFLPLVLSKVLNEIEKGYQKTDNLTLFTIGAPVPEQIRKQVRSILADQIIESYGTNETGSIAIIDEMGSGQILPDLTVEVVDDNDKSVFGQIGHIRIKNEGLVKKYTNHSEATKRSFKNGWFYPNDLAIMQNNFVIKLIGRSDDQLNIQGIKFNPYPLEHELKSNLPIQNACILEIKGKDGLTQIHVCTSPHNDKAKQDVIDQIKPMLPSVMETVHLSFFKDFPLTANGKIQRRKLIEFLEN